MLAKFLAHQLGGPSGLPGRILGRLMNRMNSPMHDSTLALLQPRDGETVLEVGFGGGVTLERLLRTLPSSKIYGVEMSPTMLNQAQARFSKESEEGRIDLRHGVVGDLPLADQRIDCAFTINTIYFWPDASQGFEELHRVLKPQGRLAVTFADRAFIEKAPVFEHGFTAYDPGEVTDLCEAAGFTSTRIVCMPGATRTFYIVEAFKE
jgi:ubiquinone/menaquinone biosynthesis C-methylase UbiE